MTNVAPVNATAEKLIIRLRNDNAPFTYVRFGDGDLALMRGDKNEAFHTNSPELRRELIQSFKIKDSDYLIGCVAGMQQEGEMRPGVFAPFRYDARLIEQAEKHQPDAYFENPIALAYKYVFDNGWWVDFVDIIRSKKTLFIGSESVGRSYIPWTEFNAERIISLSDSNSYDDLQKWDEWEWISIQARLHDLIVCATGVATRVIAKRLWKEGVRVTFIDIGSVVDALAGIKSRTWIKETQ